MTCLVCCIKIIPLWFYRQNFRNLEDLKPSEDAITARLTTPAVATMLNTENIAFTRQVNIHSDKRLGMLVTIWNSGPVA